MCPVACAPSTTVVASTSFAMLHISATGLIEPIALDTCAIETIEVSGVSNALYLSRSIEPSSSTGATFSTAPVCSHRICQGTMFEWCSISVMRISSPAPMFGLAKPCATKLIASVAPRTKTTSSGRAAPKYVAMRARAFSYACVARMLSVWTPRWIFALSCS